MVSFDQVKVMKTDLELQIAAETSSKVWEDFNVHKAFNKTLTAAYNYKYVVWVQQEEQLPPTHNQL